MKSLSPTEQKIASAHGMYEAMRHQRDKAHLGLDAAQAEIKHQRAVLAKAPHHPLCDGTDTVWPSADPLCDCWKSKENNVAPHQRLAKLSESIFKS